MEWISVNVFADRCLLVSNYLGEYMSLAKFRKVFKGHKEPSPPIPKVSPENTDSQNPKDK